MSLSPDAGAFNSESLEQTVPGAFPGSALGQQSAPATANQTLAQAVFERRSEYTRPQKIRIKIGTWNVAAIKGTEKDIRGWFIDGKGVDSELGGLPRNQHAKDSSTKDDFGEPKSAGAQQARLSSGESTLPENEQGSIPSGDEIGIYALGLQEVVDVTSAVEALKPYTDPSVAIRFKNVVSEALPDYNLIAEQQLIGLLLLVYASPRIAPEIRSVSTTSVGTGLMGYMGNKGAVTARILLGQTTRLVFVNSHLSAGFDKAALERRIWDTGQILSRTKFDPITDSTAVSESNGETLGDEDFSFWFGDLNFRLEGMPGDDVRRLLTLHTTKRYGITEAQGMGNESAPPTDSDGYPTSDSASTSSTLDGATLDGEDMNDPAGNENQELDPTSLQATLLSLLPHDELYQQQSAKKAFHEGWREGPIEFLPTYKYDVGTVANFDSSEKRRCPSYCDRILYRTRRDKANFEKKAKEEQEAVKEESSKSRGAVRNENSDDDDLLFDYDPGADGDGHEEYRDDDGDTIITKEGFEDEISLEYYVSHQRVLSSDHKPLDAVFKLKYDAVVPELKAKVHQEVARDLDRAENEGRPSVTLIIEDHSADRSQDQSSPTSAEKYEGVNFGDVRYAQQKHRGLTVANTGQVPAVINFVDRPTAEGDAEGSFPPWLSVKFDRDPDKKEKSAPKGSQQYTLEPGDTCSVELAIRVELMKLIRDLNSESASLDDVLVLRVADGRDHFIPVRGRWLHTSLGQTIDKLIRIPEGGIRKLQRQQPAGSTGSTTTADSHGVKWSAPRELFRLTECVEDQVVRALAEWDMKGGQRDEKSPWLAHAGWPFANDSWYFTDKEKRSDLISNIVNALDTDASLDSSFEPEQTSLQRLEVYSETLLAFLSGFEDGVITSDQWLSIEKETANREKSKQPSTANLDQRTSILEILSSAPSHSVSFVLLTSMLARIASEITMVSNDTGERRSLDLPASPQTKIRRKTLSQDPSVARKQIVIKTFAAIFANVVIKAPDMPKSKDKEKRVREEKMRDVVELFLSEQE